MNIFMDNNSTTINRWRLILGSFSENSLSFSQDTVLNYADMDDVLDFLYSREYGEERGIRKGSLNPSMLTVPEWITKVRELFPKATVETLERHALEKYNMSELLTDKEVLEKMEPNIDLLKSILQMKHLMKGEVLETARKIVKQVADDIKKRLGQDIRAAIMGRIDRSSTSRLKSSRNIDFKRTIRKNLSNYDFENNRLMVKNVYFNRRIKRYNPWRVIIAVDESGSMLSSVIHSAVMAGIFAQLPMLKTNLLIFDTEIVDLTGYIDDPVETLMSVQLGGGTNIAKALQYCNGLLESPHRTMVIVVTDLCEGGPSENMFRQAKNIIEAGAKLIVLTSLDMQAVPVYDKAAAEKMVSLGANVAALTPEGLAKWIAEIIS